MIEAQLAGCGESVCFVFSAGTNPLPFSADVLFPAQESKYTCTSTCISLLYYKVKLSANLNFKVTFCF